MLDELAKVLNDVIDTSEACQEIVQQAMMERSIDIDDEGGLPKDLIIPAPEKLSLLGMINTAVVRAGKGDRRLFAMVSTGDEGEGPVGTLVRFEVGPYKGKS